MTVLRTRFDTPNGRKCTRTAHHIMAICKKSLTPSPSSRRVLQEDDRRLGSNTRETDRPKRVRTETRRHAHNSCVLILLQFFSCCQACYGPRERSTSRFFTRQKQLPRMETTARRKWRPRVRFAGVFHVCDNNKRQHTQAAYLVVEK